MAILGAGEDGQSCREDLNRHSCWREEVPHRSEVATGTDRENDRTKRGGNLSGGVTRGGRPSGTPIGEGSVRCTDNGERHQKNDVRQRSKSALPRLQSSQHLRGRIVANDHYDPPPYIAQRYSWAIGTELILTTPGRAYRPLGRGDSDLQNPMSDVGRDSRGASLRIDLFDNAHPRSDMTEQGVRVR